MQQDNPIHLPDVFATSSASVDKGKMKNGVSVKGLIKSFFFQGKALAKNRLYVTMVISNCIGTAGKYIPFPERLRKGQRRDRGEMAAKENRIHTVSEIVEKVSAR